MATKECWADAKFERGSTLFSRYFPALDSLISPDDPVRLIAEVLDEAAVGSGVVQPHIGFSWRRFVIEPVESSTR